MVTEQAENCPEAFKELFQPLQKTNICDVTYVAQESEIWSIVRYPELGIGGMSLEMQIRHDLELWHVWYAWVRSFYEEAQGPRFLSVAEVSAGRDLGASLSEGLAQQGESSRPLIFRISTTAHYFASDYGNQRYFLALPSLTALLLIKSTTADIVLTTMYRLTRAIPTALDEAVSCFDLEVTTKN